MNPSMPRAFSMLIPDGSTKYLAIIIKNPSKGISPGTSRLYKIYKNGGMSPVSTPWFNVAFVEENWNKYIIN
jgi:hypothetical protein